MLRQDNSKLQKQVIQHLQQGKQWFNNATNTQQRDRGYKEMMMGLRKLHNLYNRTSNGPLKQKFKQYLQSNVDEAKRMKKQIEGEKVVVQEPNSDGQTQKKRGGDDKDDKEKDKFRNQIMGTIQDKCNVKWTDVAGLKQAKKSLQEAVILPIRFPELFTGTRKPWKGILLYGPPGTGKTFLAKACATETEGTFFNVSSADLISKYVGESEKLIKTLFGIAGEKKPSIIFIDEVDSMAGNRSEGENEASRRVKTEFLVQMQGVGNDNDSVLVLGATNLPWGLDPAIRRRFERRIYIPLPDSEARQYLLQLQAKKNDAVLTQQELEKLSTLTEGFSGSDISNMVKDAVYEPLRISQDARFFGQVIVDGKQKWTPITENQKGQFQKWQECGLYDLPENSLKVPPVNGQSFIRAAEKCKPSVGQDQLGEYEKWTEEFGLDG